MPAPVDHEARRRDVAAIAAGLIAERGADALTFRELAGAAGYSTSVVSHYFRNKNDLLLFMFRTSATHGESGLEAAMAGGETPLKCLEAILPLDERRLRNWHVVLAFWGKAAANPEFRKEQSRRGRESLRLVKQVIAKEDEDAARTDLRARTILTAIVGIATQAVFDPKAWPPERQLDVLREAYEGTTRA